VSLADIVTTCTACKQHVDVVKKGWIKKGTHINGIGGDCPGKTEIDIELVKTCRIFVEYFDQSFIEGEIQRFEIGEAKKRVEGEVHELVSGKKVGRVDDEAITLYDSVGIALEDYSVLMLVKNLINRYNLGVELNMLPNIQNPKDLFSLVK
jgi:ornithine cyclodeaminase